MEALLRDLRYAVRTLRRNPGFGLVAVLTLALGIGATTTIFSVVNGVLLRPLSYPSPERIVWVAQVGSQGGRMNVSDANFADLYEQSRSFAALAQYGSSMTSVTGGIEPARVLAATVSRDFFAALGTQPWLGRTFLPEEQQEGAAPAVVVSHGYWRRSLGADPNLAGRTLTFQDRVHPVVGVMPPGFQYPVGAELWTPRELHPVLPSRTAHNWQVVGRLREGVTLDQARQDLSALARRLKQQHGDETTMADAAVVPLHEHLVGRVRPALLVLLGAAALLLLITCANVGNLLLARMASRRRELAVRVSLGASRARLARQFLTESLVLALAGGALGVLLAYGGVAALLALEPGNLPRLDEIGVDPVVLGFALAVSVLTAAALGLVGALRAGGGDLRVSLAEVQRSQSGGVSSQRMRNVLVAGQFALTLVLLVGAGLLGRSLLQLLAIDPGFRTAGAVTMHLALAPAGDDEGRSRLARFHDELLERLRTIPGVEHVGGVTDFPLGGSFSNGTFLTLAHADEVASFEDFGRLSSNPERIGHAEYRIASDGYFPAMGIPLVRGRLFEARDLPDAPHVAVVSEALARTQWPGEDPIGKLIQFGNMDGDLRPFTVVGVVGDVRDYGVDAEPRPTFYASHRQRPRRTWNFHLVLQGAADPGSMTAAAHRIVREIDPTLPPRFRSLDEVVSVSLAERRFSLLLLGIFGTTALLLAAMGIYGLTAYAVAQRAREIGIRIALGARPGSVLGLVVRQSTVLALVGIALGVAAATALTGLLAHLLHGVSTTDPVTFVAAVVFLGGVALLASYLPARRATEVDPSVALRAE